jgi:hypothetical protein
MDVSRYVEQIASVLESQISKLYSQRSQKFAIPLGFFFYSCGISRKAIDMLSRCGMCPSYDSLRRCRKILADGMMCRARQAARGPHLLGWDNTNIKMSIHVEQRELAPAKVQSGTTSIIYELRNATPDDMRLTPVLERRAALEMINFNSNIRPTRSHMRDMTKHFELDIIKILVEHQSGFDYLTDEALLKHRQYRPPPTNHKTKEYVLRTTIIEESSIAGNIKVNDNIYLVMCRAGLEALDGPCRAHSSPA